MPSLRARVVPVLVLSFWTLKTSTDVPLHPTRLDCRRGCSSRPAIGKGVSTLRSCARLAGRSRLRSGLRLLGAKAALRLCGGSDEQGDPADVVAEGLTNMCARHLENSGQSEHLAASAEELSALILNILKGPGADTQNVLLDLLGYNALDLIGWVLEHSHALLRSDERAKPVCVDARGHDQQCTVAPPVSSLQAPPKGMPDKRERKLDIQWREDHAHNFKEAIILPPRRCANADKKDLVPVTAFGPYLCRALPSHMTHLNAVQSRVFHQAFHTSLNLLVLAPTGAGKTMVRPALYRAAAHARTHAQ